MLQKAGSSCIMSAGGVDISFAKSNPKIHAILWAGYPGAEGVKPLLMLFLENTIQVTLTWYQADYVDKIPLTSLQLRPDDSKGYPGRTYKFFDGDGDGDEIVLVYSQPPLGILRTHIKQLNKFQRVSVAAGASKLVRFAINIARAWALLTPMVMLSCHLVPHNYRR
ncbi:beta-d-xylosidase 4 [Quercus suber]|uniref:Beta-d-xylosidase 4 n=1 Tax=Quercus suber TaxID=58331 RepID=A0AAW0JVK7_QUESU